MAITSGNAPTLSLKYRDLDLSFTKHPITKDIPIKTGEKAVVQSVMNLVQLGYYEKPFHPEIQCGVRQLLFENETPLVSQQIRSAILEVIRNHEPRASVISLMVTPAIQSGMHGYFITISFFINGSTVPTNMNQFLQRS